jgi:hypothetical protein
MPNNRLPTLQAPDSFRSALQESGMSLKDRYRNDILGLAKRLHVDLPEKPVIVMQRLGVYDPEKHGPIIPGMREWIIDVLVEDQRSSVVVGPRGGGKSFGVSFIEFVMTFIKDFDSLNLGGSELQADQVYQYLCAYVDSDPEWKKLIKGDQHKERTDLIEGNWIRVLAASSKSVRSPHAGGIRNVRGVRVERGGLLVIDEEAEAEPDIVLSALPTINTARPSVSVRCSTFHNAVGTFADVVDSHEEMGYKLYQWDIFDVAEKCNCVAVCQSSEKCFREDHTEDYIDPEDGELKEKVLHKAYCGGRAMYASGWIPMEEIEAMWKRMKRNHDKWEVEAMGSRPSTKGFVIKNQTAHAANKTTMTGDELFINIAPITLNVDWGTVAAGLEAWQQQVTPEGVKHALLYAEQIEEAGLEEIIGAILGLRLRWPNEVMEVRCDIGGGGNYLNPLLRTAHRFNVVDVNFQQDKESAVAAWNILNEAHKLILPEEHTTFHEQVKRWRRRSTGIIQKGNDHLCDTAVCYFSKFIDELGTTGVRITPRTWDTSGQIDREMPRGVLGEKRISEGRAPVIRSFGGRSGR